MSASASEALNQPLATTEELTNGSINFAGFTTTTGAFRQVPAAAFIEALGLPAMAVSVVTTNDSPVVVPGLPAVPVGGGFVALQGQIVVQNQATFAMQVWNIALVVSRTGAAVDCEPQGDVDPSPFLPVDPSLSTANVALGANSAGPAITLTPPSVPATWRVNITYTVGGPTS